LRSCSSWPCHPPGLRADARRGNGRNTGGGGDECDFDDVGWDLRAGHEVWVSYYEPDGDAVVNVFYGRPQRVFLPVVLR
jgi:hypothetical protein